MAVFLYEGTTQATTRRIFESVVFLFLDLWDATRHGVATPLCLDTHTVGRVEGRNISTVEQATCCRTH
ncbi:hypothetical protein VTJ04DRAFT_2288 [Mycothermus thermophilus]|uniref:uncharacterized protein n=1 Tax=Humicola insolens TaxID=85995 RepID=UPI00374324F4